MAKEQGELVNELFQQAMALPRSERDAWLAQQPVSSDVIEEVRRLVEHAQTQPAQGPLTAETSDGANAGSAGQDFGTQIHAFDGVGTSYPKQIGHYRIIKQIGRGGMGVVLLGVRDDDHFHKRVAIKLIRRGIDSGGDGREILKRFDLERRVLGALNHANIARLLDAGQLPDPDGRPYFVMEYVEGEPIDGYCDRMRLTTEQRLALFQKVCAAVHHAHQNLVVHRDIKPSNILVDVSGEPKLMDFGIVKIINPAMAGVTIATRLDRGPMTPEYASPEQVQGKPISTVSDVYSLGVLLYELLTGRRPYRLKSRAIDAMVKAICDEEPERPSTAVTREQEVESLDGTTSTATAASLAKPREGDVTRLRRKLSGDLDNIVLMAMRKSPQRRYASAEAMAADINRHLAGQPVSAAPDSVVYRAGKFVRRNKIGVAAAAIVVASILGGATVATVSWRRASVARDAALAARLQAEGLLAAVRKFGSAYTTELPRIIGPMEDSTPALRALAVSSMSGLEELRKGFATDAEMQRQVANAYSLAGRIRGGMKGGNEGDSAEGLRVLDEAIKIRREVVGLAGGDKRSRMELASTLIYRADALKLQKRPKDAQDAQQEALKIVEELGADGVDDPVLGRQYAVVLSARADGLMDQRKYDEAQVLLDKSLRIREHLAEGNDHDMARQRDLTVAWGRLGLLEQLRGKPDEAVPYFKRAYSKREELLAQDRSARTTRDAAIAAGAYGRALLELEPPNVADAEPALKRQVDLLSSLACSDSTDNRNAADLVRAYSDLGKLYLIDHATAPEAVARLRRAIELGAAGKLDRVLMQELQRARELLGDALAGLGQKAEARKEYRASLDLVREIGTELPGMEDAETRIKKAMTKLGSE